MKTHLHGIARKLAEFGWLWAVKGNNPFDPEWTETTVKVRFATKALFDHQDIHGDAWAYGLDKKGVPTLRNASQGWDDRLGSMALYATTSGRRGSGSTLNERVEYIALKNHDRKMITIFRPPKGMTMWEFLQRYDLLR